MHNKVSIIIPAYNTVDVISRTLQSVENQTYKNYEIIIVNDGSTDSTKEFLDNYKENKNNVIVYHQKNQGVSAARNKGIELSTGEFVCFLDSDDTYEPTFLEEMLQHLLKNKSEVVYCGHNYINKKNEVKSYNIYCNKNHLFSYFKSYMFHFSAMLINKESLIREKIVFDKSIRLGEDTLFAVMVLVKLKVYCLKNRCLFNYTYRKNSVTQKDKTIGYFYNYDLAYNYVYNYINNNYNQIDKKDVLFCAEMLKNEYKVNIFIYFLIQFDFKSLRNELRKLNIKEIYKPTFPLSKSRRKTLFFIKDNNILKFILGSIYYRYIRK